jgi:hypothetical protein
MMSFGFVVPGMTLLIGPSIGTNPSPLTALSALASQHELEEYKLFSVEQVACAFTVDSCPSIKKENTTEDPIVLEYSH